jgi:hypothetical protein
MSENPRMWMRLCELTCGETSSQVRNCSVSTSEMLFQVDRARPMRFPELIDKSGLIKKILGISGLTLHQMNDE